MEATNVNLLEENFKRARIERNEIAKALYSTLKGEYENSVKNGNEAGNATLEKIARKMVKNAEMVGTEDAKREIELLSAFVSKEMSEAEIREIVQAALANCSAKVEEYRKGNKGSVGFFMGTVMKATSGKANPKVVTRILNEELESA